MKNKLRLVGFFTLCFLLTNCKEKKANTLANSIKKINITKVFEKEEKLNLSKIAKSIEYISLESNKDNILGRITKKNRDIQIFENNILIKDKSFNLFLFNNKGGFKTRIGSMGKGPGEYTRIEEIIPIPNKGLIAAYSASQQKVLMYNLEGEFEYSFKIDFWPLGLTYFNENLIFFNLVGRRKLTDYYAMSIFNLKGELIKRLHYKEEEKKFEKNNTLRIKTRREEKFILNDTLRFWEGDYGKDIVYSLTKDLKIIPTYSVDFDDQLWTLDMYSESKKIGFEEMVKHSNIERYFESSAYLFFSIAYAKKRKFFNVLYNKKTEEGHSVSYKRENGKGLRFKFYNDIDGGMPFWPQGKVSDDKMYMIIHGYELKDYLARKKKKDNPIIDELGRKKLLDIAENAKISDNPILMIVTLKND